MIDNAEKAAEDDERAMAQFEEGLRQQRIAASFRVRDPSQPIHCLDCGESVSVERQQAYPYTRRCVACAAEVERSYRRGDPA